MKPGDTVRCLYPGGGALIRGRSYQVISCEDDWIVIQNETGLPVCFPSVRFQTQAPSWQEAGLYYVGDTLLSILRRPFNEW